MVPFAGFAMPVQYTLDRRRAPRGARGGGALRRLAHGPARARGRPAAALRRAALHARDERRWRPGACAMRCLCNEAGGVVDDLTVYRIGDDSFLLCVNAANIAKDRAWIERTRPPATRAARRERRDRPARAPGARGAGRSWPALAAPRSARCAASAFADARARRAARCSRRAPATPAPTASSSTARPATRRGCSKRCSKPAGRTASCRPGLGARDTLRLEAALPLYGHELDDDDEPARGGPRPLRRARAATSSAPRRSGAAATPEPTRALVGFVVTGRGIARAGYPVLARRRARSAASRRARPRRRSDRAIGLAYVPPAHAAARHARSRSRCGGARSPRAW